MREGWEGGKRRVSSFQVPSSAAAIYPIISATLSRAASCFFCSRWFKIHEDPSWCGGRKRSEWETQREVLSKREKKKHLFLYLQHTSTWAAISKPAAIWVSFLQMFVLERNGTNSNVEGKRKRLIKVEPGENYSLKTLLPYWLQLHILGWHSQTIIQDQHSKSKQKP